MAVSADSPRSHAHPLQRTQDPSVLREYLSLTPLILLSDFIISKGLSESLPPDDLDDEGEIQSRNSTQLITLTAPADLEITTDKLMASGSRSHIQSDGT